MRDFCITFGGRDVSLANPTPESINTKELAKRVETIRRFSGDPRALTVGHHERFVAALCKADPLSVILSSKANMAECVVYGRVHDRPEALTGDVPAPLKAYLRSQGDYALDRVETRLTRAVLAAYGINEVRDEVLRAVYKYDKVAAALEWRFAMLEEWAPWCDEDARSVDHTLARHLINVTS